MSPSTNRPAYRPMEPSNPDASPWGRRGRLCAIHGWGCPNRIAPAQGPSSSSHQGEEEEREEDDDERHIMVVTGPIGVPVIHWMTCISVGPRGQPQGPLAPRTNTTPPSSLTSLTLAAPPLPPLALPSPKVEPSGSNTPLELLSLCDNRVF
jgi:hypothetical protein